MRVLIAIDDTDASRDAVSFAEQLLSDDTHVVVVNVVRSAWTPFHQWTDPLAAAWQPLPPLDDSAEREAAGLVRDLAGQLGDAQTKLSHGDPGAAISRLAVEQDVDLIVVGTHDKRAWTRTWFPSVSRFVVDHAPCPVLVIR